MNAEEKKSTSFLQAWGRTTQQMRQMAPLDQAVYQCERAVRQNPTDALLCNRLANALREAGRPVDAIHWFRRAAELDPACIGFHSNLLFMLSFHPDCNAQDLLDEARRFAACHPVPSRSAEALWAEREPTAGRRLRIGYVSPDFRAHCQSFFTVPLLSHHDRTAFEVFCYAQVSEPDDVTERLRACADGWRPTHGKTDAEVAQMIDRDKIDLLVDLTMHMAHGRPLLFARRAAPVQIAWLAYPGTTGLPAMDYRLTDPWLDPPGVGDAFYSETSIRLPDTFWCYDPLIASDELQPNALPALHAGHITFGCLNNPCKLSDDTLSRWGQVMAQLPSSRLIVLVRAGRQRARVIEQLAAQGVAADRIEFVEYMPRLQYLQTYHRIDLCLDTLPANGHTTSLDAYWMGVPVVSQLGHTVVGRAGWSQLNNLGLQELVATDGAGFVTAAVDLATDLPRLSHLRQTLRRRMQASALMDGQRFAAAVEAVYRQVCEG